MQSPEAEQALIGAVLIHPEVWPQVSAICAPDDFAEPVHAALWEAAGRLKEAGRPLTPETMLSAMSEALRGAAEELGGPKYLVRLAAAATYAEAAVEHAQMVRDLAIWRELHGLGAELQDAATRASIDAPPSEAVAEAMERLASLTAARLAARPVRVGDTASRLLRALDGGEPVRGAPVPWPAVAEIMPTLMAGQLALIAARPSAGKTALACNLALMVARAGHPVVFASLEMPPEHVTARLAAAATPETGMAVAYSQMLEGSIPGDRVEVARSAIREVASLPITYLDGSWQELRRLRAGIAAALTAPAVRRADKPPLVVVDYAQLVRAAGRSAYEQASEVALALKELAVRHDVPVVALAQLSRQVEQREDKRPRLSDLRDTGRFEEAADAIWFLFRPAYYLEREAPDASDVDAMMEWQRKLDEERTKLEIAVAKNRNGRIGVARVRFNPALSHVWQS